MRSLTPFLLALLLGCGSPVVPMPPVTPAATSGPDFPLGTQPAAFAPIPDRLPTDESAAVVNYLATLTPAAMAATSGCAGCSGMTMTIDGASYPGFGKSFNGTYNFVKVGTDPNSCLFEAESTWTWRFILRPSSQFGGWELIGQQFSGVQVVYHTASDPSNGGTGWTGAGFSLIFSSTGESVPQNVSVN